VPRTPRDAAIFVLSLWLSISCLLPIGASWADSEDAQLARLEGQLVQGVNDFRKSRRLIPLERRPELDAVARAHSEDMVRRHFFAHRNPEGLDWVGRLRRAGIQGFALAGENLAMTSQSRPNTRILEGWKHSPAHLKNLVARPYNATGVGIARGPDGALYYTQLYLTFPR